MSETVHMIHGDHPALAGHFPGSPMPPAVLLLQYLADAVEQQTLGKSLLGLARTRFKTPLKVGVEFEIRIENNESGRCKFEIVQEGVQIMTGLALTAQ